MIYVFLADGFEEIEALTPVDYLRRCGSTLKTVSVNKTLTVKGSHGITVTADITIDDITDFSDIQMIVLPGGMPGTVNLEACDKLSKIIDYCDDSKIFIGAICAAPSILGHKNILSGKVAVCYPGFEKELFGAKITDNSTEVSGHIITAKGAGAANLFAFELIKALYGKDKSEKLKASICF